MSSLVNNADSQDEELRKKIEELEAASRSKDAFIANISHEVRTPMNAILGFSELILQLDESDTVNEYATEIKNASKNLLSIINDLLDISKIESGKMELSSVAYYLHYLFTDIESIMSIPVQNKGIEFKVNIDPELPSQLFGDIVRIRQVLTNLCNNAVKFTKEGYVELSASFEKYDGNGVDDNESTVDMTTLVFSVRDTGIGITKENLEKIFDKFQQVDMRKNRGIEGTGLGLSISRQLIELMSGTIEVDSVYGEGTTFTVRIPQKVLNYQKLSSYVVNRSSEAKKEIKSVLYAPSAKLLVVDDNPVNLRIISGLLLHYEIEADCALSGMEAIEKSKSQQYDLIFMDHMMPEMDGVEALGHIRKIDGYESIPVVAVTANAIRGVRDEFIAKGFQDYLSKPIEVDRLENILKRNLNKELLLITEEAVAIVPESLDIEIKGIDIDIGLAKCDNSVKDYLEILEIVAEYGPDKCEELRMLAENGDIENYTIAAHSLKSVAANIGALQLSTMARIHEMAGKNGQSAFVNGNYKRLIDLYQMIVSNICSALDEYNTNQVTD